MPGTLVGTRIIAAMGVDRIPDLLNSGWSKKDNKQTRHHAIQWVFHLHITEFPSLFPSEMPFSLFFWDITFSYLSVYLSLYLLLNPLHLPGLAWWTSESSLQVFLTSLISICWWSKFILSVLTMSMDASVLIPAKYSTLPFGCLIGFPSLPWSPKSVLIFCPKLLLLESFLSWL